VEAQKPTVRLIFQVFPSKSSTQTTKEHHLAHQPLDKSIFKAYNGFHAIGKQWGGMDFYFLSQNCEFKRDFTKIDV
jgi:hypothetical protein